mmetsp:Transcript_5845/g.17064  ORF Transcript_5845/g.17064 Transcript_5845/m.17064 type:complete len:379 (-) Transcript_5845:1430-2566(-)
MEWSYQARYRRRTGDSLRLASQPRLQDAPKPVNGGLSSCLHCGSRNASCPVNHTLAQEHISGGVQGIEKEFRHVGQVARCHGKNEHPGEVLVQGFGGDRWQCSRNRTRLVDGRAPLSPEFLKFFLGHVGLGAKLKCVRRGHRDRCASRRGGRGRGEAPEKVDLGAGDGEQGDGIGRRSGHVARSGFSMVHAVHLRAADSSPRVLFLLWRRVLGALVCSDELLRTLMVYDSQCIELLEKGILDLDFLVLGESRQNLLGTSSARQKDILGDVNVGPKEAVVEEGAIMHVLRRRVVRGGRKQAAQHLVHLGWTLEEESASAGKQRQLHHRRVPLLVVIDFLFEGIWCLDNLFAVLPKHPKHRCLGFWLIHFLEAPRKDREN